MEGEGAAQPTLLAQDLWLGVCVYSCVRLLSMATHSYACLHPNTQHTCVRLGLGTQRWTSCTVMHCNTRKNNWCRWNFSVRALCIEKGHSGPTFAMLVPHPAKHHVLKVLQCVHQQTVMPRENVEVMHVL